MILDDIQTCVNAASWGVGFGFALESIVILTGHVIFFTFRMFKRAG